MSITIKTLDRLPEKYRRQIEAYRARYQRDKTNTADKDRANGYITALADAEIITQAEKRLILAYITL